MPKKKHSGGERWSLIIEPRRKWLQLNLPRVFIVHPTRMVEDSFMCALFGIGSM